MFDLNLQDIKGKNYLEPGQPCGHRGCESHLSHPCEGCGRYAAGMRTKPDVELAMARLRELSVNDTFLYKHFTAAAIGKWSREEFLVAALLELHKRSTQLQK